MNLDIKHLAAYLPYDTTIILDGKRYELVSLSSPYKTNDKLIVSCELRCELREEGGTYRQIRSFVSGNNEAKLELRSLHDLNKEIEVKGEKFVPYDKLKTVVSEEQWVNICNAVDLKEYNKVIDMPYWWVRQLFEWHFDVFGLIENNLAVAK